MQHADACRRYADGSRGSGLPSDAEEAWKEMRQSLTLASEGEGTAQALLHWMKLEAYGARSLSGTLTAGRKLMGHWGAFYNAWSAFITAARYCGAQLAEVEGLYKDALQQVSDYPDQVSSDFLQFQRESGTLEGWLAARAQLAEPEPEAKQESLERDGATAPKAKARAPKPKPVPRKREPKAFR
ncbi:unnamed protein product, partial [Effrenium voratum]